MCTQSMLKVEVVDKKNIQKSRFDKKSNLHMTIYLYLIKCLLVLPSHLHGSIYLSFGILNLIGDPASVTAGRDTGKQSV